MVISVRPVPAGNESPTQMTTGRVSAELGMDRGLALRLFRDSACSRHTPSVDDGVATTVTIATISAVRPDRRSFRAPLARGAANCTRPIPSIHGQTYVTRSDESGEGRT
jgi:hypothetical protein